MRQDDYDDGDGEDDNHDVYEYDEHGDEDEEDDDDDDGDDDDDDVDRIDVGRGGGEERGRARGGADDVDTYHQYFIFIPLSLLPE